MPMALVGGKYGSRILSALSHDGSGGLATGVPKAYLDHSKLEVLLGPDVWDRIRGKVVVDFGCGEGREVVELVEHGASHVVGVDIRDKWLAEAAALAVERGVGDRCTFVRAWDAPASADVIISLDSFEHFADPAAILRVMEAMLAPDGRVLVAFGPPWYHPYGGHLFSVFPWAHCVFTEAAMLQWRSNLPGKKPAATLLEAGLNKMTVHGFQKLIAESGFEFAAFKAVPIRKLRWLAHHPLRELTTSIVRCELVRRRTP
jgi:SAM-dependent methyltransferase